VIAAPPDGTGAVSKVPDCGLSELEPDPPRAITATAASAGSPQGLDCAPAGASAMGARLLASLAAA
jgi:hypothetical protein